MSYKYKDINFWHKQFSSFKSFFFFFWDGVSLCCPAWTQIILLTQPPGYPGLQIRTTVLTSSSDFNFNLPSYIFATLPISYTQRSARAGRNLQSFMKHSGLSLNICWKRCSSTYIRNQNSATQNISSCKH